VTTHPLPGGYTLDMRRGGWPARRHGRRPQGTVRAKAALITALALLTVSVPVVAADPAIDAVNRAQRLLALRGHRLATIIVLDEWPPDAPSAEAFAMRDTIFVNSAGSILTAAVRSTRFDVVLASVLLHEQAHLAGATERQALQIELAWLTSERADDVVIQELRRAIEREARNRTPPGTTIVD